MLSECCPRLLRRTVASTTSKYARCTPMFGIPEPYKGALFEAAKLAKGIYSHFFMIPGNVEAKG